MSDNPAGETLIGVKSPSMTLVVAASAAGTAFEWYDFFVFVPLASILAKVARDRLMVEMDELYPGYGFAGHKGYHAQVHTEALRRLGPCPIHRQGWAPVRLALMGMDPMSASADPFDS